MGGTEGKEDLVVSLGPGDVVVGLATDGIAHALDVVWQAAAAGTIGGLWGFDRWGGGHPTGTEGCHGATGHRFEPTEDGFFVGGIVGDGVDGSVGCRGGCGRCSVGRRGLVPTTW